MVKIIKRNNLILLLILSSICLRTFSCKAKIVVGSKLPGGQVEAMLYNSIGQLTAKTDFAGKTTQYSYDQRGRLTKKTPDPTLGENAVTFSYPNEFTKISTRGSIQNVYKYDAQRGWLNSVQTPNGKIDYSYDQAGNRTVVKITGKDGGVRETDYSYDALNRVSSVSRVGVGTLANYSYTAVGNVANVTRANGVISSYGYDDLHRLTAIEHKKGTEVLSQFNYVLSADGKRNTLQEYLNYPTGQTVASVNRTVFYGYDAAGRLDAEQRQSTSTLTAGGSIAKTARTLWTYDKVGNRQTQAVSNYDGIGIDSPSVLKSTFNTNYSYNNNDWLLSTNSTRHDDSDDSTFVTNFEYNQNGSQKAVTSNVGKPEEKRIPYFYDFEEKLTAIGDLTDTVRHNYWYDADGNRIVESNTAAGNTNVRNYLVDPNNSNAQVMEEYDNANALLAHYDWNDAELLREASWNASTNAYDIHEPLADGHNNIRQLLNSTGAISDVYSFDAWGIQQENVGGSLNPYRYNSQRLDANGLYYLRARQYASGIGRFLSHDPVLGDMNNPITQHRYLYAEDDAVNAIDPSGNFAAYAETIGISGLETVGRSLDIGSKTTIIPRVIGVASSIGIATGMVIGAIIDDSLDIAQEADDTSKKEDPPLIYRGGNAGFTNLTPRPIKDTEGDKRGLSTFVTPAQAVRFKPNQKFQRIDVRRLLTLGKGELIIYPTLDGHVSIRPTSDELLREWSETRGTGNVHHFTLDVQEAITGEGIWPRDQK